MTTPRRNALKKLFASVAATVGLGAVAKAGTNTDTAGEKEVFNVVDDQDVPLFSGATKFKGLVFIAGKGAHFQGDIKSHTDHVLKELQKRTGKSRLFHGKSIESKCVSRRH